MKNTAIIITVLAGMLSACGSDTGFVGEEPCLDCFEPDGAPATETRTLSLEQIGGPGEAEVFVNDQPCESPCVVNVEYDAAVRVEVKPALQASFRNWQEPCGEELVCEFVVTEDISLGFYLDVAGEPLSQISPEGLAGVASTVVDSEGNFYMVGMMRWQRPGDPRRLLASKLIPYVVKLSPEGALLWSEEFDSQEDNMRSGGFQNGLLALSPDEQSLYVAGIGRGVSSEFEEMRLYQLDTQQGTRGWQRDMVWRRSNGYAQPANLIVGTTGRIYLAGLSTTSFSASGQTVNSRGNLDSFLLTYTEGGALSGVIQWNPLHESDVTFTLDLVPDVSGGVYVLNQHQIVPEEGARDSSQMIAHIGSDGVLQSEVPVHTSVSRIAPTAEGGFVIAGSYSRASTAAELELPTPVDNDDVFLGEVGPDGSVRWIRALGGDRDEYPRSLVVDRHSNIHLLAKASYSGFSDFGGGTLPSLGTNDGIAASYSATGEFRWAHVFGTSGAAEPQSMSRGPNDQLFVFGEMRETLTGPMGELSAPFHHDTRHDPNIPGDDSYAPYILSFHQ